MSYSITPILHPHKDKSGLQKVQIRIIYNRMKVYDKTDIRVREDQFRDGSIVNHPSEVKINSLLRKQLTDDEDRLLEAMRGDINAVKLRSLFSERQSMSADVFTYIENLCERLKDKFSEGSLKHYRSLGKKIEKNFPGVSFGDIDIKWLQRFEKHLREDKLDGNTINGNMKRFKSILYKAAADGLISENDFSNYQVPSYKQKLVEYLTEKELESLTKIIRATDNPDCRTAGYYFLLSCYAGYRISDVKRFNYDEMVLDGKKIILRAKKNGQIVSILIHSRLREVLKFIKTHPLNLAEQKIRDCVRDLCKMAGIKKAVKFHTGRHSFAMLLMANGFTIDEVSEMIGDSELVTKVYAKVHNESLDRKVRERLG